MHNNKKVEQVISLIDEKLLTRTDVHYGAAIMYGKQKYCEKGGYWDQFKD
jgi:hypothetical protein